MPEWGYGMTNLIARITPGINGLDPSEYAKGRRVLFRKIRKYRPEVVALIGVTLFRALFPGVADVRLGLQGERLEGARVFVLPNPSGRNAHFTHAQMLVAFKALKRHLDREAVHSMKNEPSWNRCRHLWWTGSLAAGFATRCRYSGARGQFLWPSVSSQRNNQRQAPS